jgi:hypothetical protein
LSCSLSPALPRTADRQLGESVQAARVSTRCGLRV